MAMYFLQNLNVLFIIILSCGRPSQGWSYADESSWPEEYCEKGISQSPIDLKDDENTINDEGPKLSLKNWDEVYEATIINDGQMVQIRFDSADITITDGGRLNGGTFKLLRFGLHWNSDHTINGERKAFEVTAVLCNILFENCDEAELYVNGNLFVSTLYEFQDQDNEILNPIMQSLDSIRTANSSTKIKLNPRSLLPGNLDKFYRYTGSFSKPNCNEGKPWTVFEELCKISQNQVNQFMELMGENGDKLKKTYRDTQKLNSRTIFKITAT